eukprot:scaffold6667_cov19-Tisochrysis_lutea.AAC.1
MHAAHAMLCVRVCLSACAVQRGLSLCVCVLSLWLWWRGASTAESSSGKVSKCGFWQRVASTGKSSAGSCMTPNVLNEAPHSVPVHAELAAEGRKHSRELSRELPPHLMPHPLSRGPSGSYEDSRGPYLRSVEKMLAQAPMGLAGVQRLPVKVEGVMSGFKGEGSIALAVICQDHVMAWLSWASCGHIMLEIVLTSNEGMNALSW